MNFAVESAARAVEQMDSHLRNERLKKDGVIQKKKLWENTYISHQISKRNRGERFSTSEHIQAMVYSMLSSGIVWDRVANGIDQATGRIIPIDEIFYQYDPERLLQAAPQQLRDEIKILHCASQYTKKQMQALTAVNIKKLIQLETQFGSVDAFYQAYIDQDPSLKTLVKALSDPRSDYKMAQLGEALTAEYLKNAGYDIAKPDRHIRRILGSKILACSEREIVPVFEAFDIVAAIARELNRSAAEVDYILWSYCASGYGGICTKRNPKCAICAGANYCRKQTGKDGMKA